MFKPDFGRNRKRVKTIILAAGYAVRLQPLTLNTPKPLLTIGGKTILDRILENIDRIKEPNPVYLISNDKFFKHFNDWVKKSKYKSRISIINDGSVSNETRLGAIKDLELVIKDMAIDDDILVVAGDNLFDVGIENFLRFSRDRNDGISVALHDIGNLEHAKNFGVVRIDNHCRIVEFEEKPQNPKTTLISTGIYYFPKRKLSFIEEYVKIQSKLDAPGYYISWLSGRDKVYGFVFTECWYDIGNMESYNKANREYSKKEEK